MYVFLKRGGDDDEILLVQHSLAPPSNIFVQLRKTTLTLLIDLIELILSCLRDYGLARLLISTLGQDESVSWAQRRLNFSNCHEP